MSETCFHIAVMTRTQARQKEVQMNILIIGGSNALCNQLILDFNKGGHRVSVLTGSYHINQKYERVFEQYNFPYESSNLTEIFESVSPDVILFTGIYDSNFIWKDVQKDSVSFVSAMLNILNTFSLLGKAGGAFLRGGVWRGSRGADFRGGGAGRQGYPGDGPGRGGSTVRKIP